MSVAAILASVDRPTVAKAIIDDLEWGINSNFITDHAAQLEDDVERSIAQQQIMKECLATGDYSKMEAWLGRLLHVMMTTPLGKYMKMTFPTLHKLTHEVTGL